jgi:PAS domain S-box-containing protein
MDPDGAPLLGAECKALFDAAPFGLAWMGPDRIVLRCNLAYEQMLGFAPGEVIGHPAPLPESERKTWETQEFGLRKGIRIVDYEGLRLRKDGSEFAALITANPRFREDGSYLGLIGVIFDNTKRQQQEFEWRMLTRMARYSPYFMGVAMTETGQATFINERGQKMFGLDGSEHVKRTNVFDYFAPSQRAAAMKDLIPTLLDRKELEFESIGRNFRTGAEFPIHCTCFVIPNSKGETAYIAAVVQDITERRSAESRLQMFRSVVQNSPDSIGVARMDLRPIFINRAGQEKFGLDDDEEVLRTHTLDYVAENERRRVRDELLPLLLSQGHLTREVLSRKLKTGEIFPALWTAFVIYDQETKTPSLLATVVKDITESKRIEEELRRHDAYLKEGQKISHTGSWIWNPANKEAIWSEELFCILGLDPKTTQASPSTYRERIHPDDLDENMRLWRQAVEKGASIDSIHRIVRPDGTIRYVRRLGHRNETALNSLELVGTVMDVTDQQHLLQQKQALEEQLKREVISLHEFTRAWQGRFTSIQKAGYETIVGSSPAMQSVLMWVDKYAKTNYTVLITGETGTGKELIAHAIHKHSNRARVPMVTVNCAGLTASIAKSELFGHEKGAFTDAHERHLGHFELAKGGTIFLDEVAELALETQSALLRVLEDRVFQRAGGTTPIRADVRVIAATNRDLEVAVADGTFRKDLYYRLKALPIELPPLRERREDIPFLVDHFIKMSLKNYKDKTIKSVEKHSLEMLTAYNWPGNIRELQNVIDRSVLLCDSETMSVDGRLLYPTPTRKPLAALPSLDKPLREGTVEYQRGRIEDALRERHGQIGGTAGAARLLGVATSTLRNQIAKLKIEAEDFKVGRRSGKRAN